MDGWRGLFGHRRPRSHHLPFLTLGLVSKAIIGDSAARHWAGLACFAASYRRPMYASPRLYSARWRRGTGQSPWIRDCARSFSSLQPSCQWQFPTSRPRCILSFRAPMRHRQVEALPLLLPFPGWSRIVRHTAGNPSGALDHLLAMPIAHPPSQHPPPAARPTSIHSYRDPSRCARML